MQRSSFFYKKVMPQPEGKSGTWRVVDNVIKHTDGAVTADNLISGCSEAFARRAAKRINRHRGPKFTVLHRC